MISYYVTNLHDNNYIVICVIQDLKNLKARLNILVYKVWKLK